MKQKLTERLRHKRLLRERRTHTVASDAERKRAEGREQNGGLGHGQDVYPTRNNEIEDWVQWHLPASRYSRS